MRVMLLGLGLMLCLNGCALPPAVTIASFAADGVSFIATGKSTTDHALSAIAQEDCAMMRALAEKAICAPARKARVETATPEPEGKHPSHARAAAPESKPAAKAPTVWDFPLIKKESVSRPEPPDTPRLVAKDTPAMPLVKKNRPIRIAEHPRRPVIRRAPPPLASGPIAVDGCGETSGMRTAAQCGLGPGA